MSPRNRPPVDEQYLAAQLDRLERLTQDRSVPVHIRLAAEDTIANMRAELDPAKVRTEAE